MSKTLLILLVLASVATACHKDEDEPTIDFGPNGGYTVRTATNIPNGQLDPTDWTSDPTWNNTERALFAKLNLPLTDPQVATGTWETTIYPNPSNRDDGCTFLVVPNMRSAALPAGTSRVSMVLVDARYNVQLSYDAEITANGLSVMPRLDPLKYSPPTLYRLYYVVYQPGKQVYYRGHGDLKFEK